MSRLLCAALLLGLWMSPAWGHHVLGRPSYSLNEDSNTPPSMQMETQVGEYFVNYMVYPAFPRAGEPGRINLYLSRLDGSGPFDGEVRFLVRDDRWFGAEEERIGTQRPDDNVFRQGFVFSRDGKYIITAAFESDGQPYRIDFPLRIGQPSAMGPLGLAVGAVLVALVAAGLLQRRRVLRGKVRAAHAEQTR